MTERRTAEPDTTGSRIQGLNPLAEFPYVEQCVSSVMARRLQDSADKVALVVDDGNQTYRELYEAGRRSAGGLRGLGVDRGDSVLLMLDNHSDAVELWLGTSFLGAVEVPVNTAYKGTILSHVIKDSGARILVIEDRYVERLVDISAGLGSIELVVTRGDGEPPPVDGLRAVHLSDVRGGSPVDPEFVAPWDQMAILYTSGTTGASKGVDVTHAHAFGYATPEYLGAATQDDRSLVSLPLFHIGGQLWGLYNAFIAGATAVLAPQFNATSYWDDVRRHACTYTTMVGAMANFLFRQPPTDADSDNPLRRVCMVPVFAEVEAFSRRFGVEVGSGFGMTEGGCPLISPFGKARATSCGRRRDDFETRLVDQNDIEVPRGAAGELVLRNRDPWRLMTGYHGLPDKTAEAWRNLWLHTGDAMFIDDDGDYIYVDRIKDAIRRRGENISSFEVEAAINSHDAVLESAVVGVPSESTEDDVLAAVVLKPGHDVAETDLLYFLIPRLPHFMIPRYIAIVPELPKTPSEKIQKQAIRDVGANSSTWDREAAGIRVTRDS